MTRLSSLALATVLTLGSAGELIQPHQAQACVDPITCAIGGAVAVVSIVSSSNKSEAQERAAKAQAAATIEAARLQAQATSELAKAQIQSALIQARAQIRIALENRLAQLQLEETRHKNTMEQEKLRNRHNTEQEKLRNRHNTEQKIIDAELLPITNFNKRFGQSMQPIFAPPSNRSTRASARLGVGGYQLFRY